MRSEIIRFLSIKRPRSVENPGGCKEKTSKKKKNIDRALLRFGVKVTVKAGKTKERTGCISAISEKGTVKLHNYGKWSEVIRIIESYNNNKDHREL